MDKWAGDALKKKTENLPIFSTKHKKILTHKANMRNIVLVCKRFLFSINLFPPTFCFSCSHQGEWLVRSTPVEDTLGPWGCLGP